jgi:uncharacterized protein YbaR (Trm112 family)
MLWSSAGRPDTERHTLLESFVCPRCKGVVAVHGHAVRCDACRLVYPVVGGIPVLVIGEARPSAPGEKVGLKPS